MVFLQQSALCKKATLPHSRPIRVFSLPNSERANYAFILHLSSGTSFSSSSICFFFVSLESLSSSCHWVSCFRALYFFFTIACLFWFLLFVSFLPLMWRLPFLLFHCLQRCYLGFRCAPICFVPLLLLSSLFTTTVAFT